MVYCKKCKKNCTNLIKYNLRLRESDEDVNSHDEFGQCSCNELSENVSERFQKNDSDQSNTSSINKIESQISSYFDFTICKTTSEINNHQNNEKIAENKNLFNIEKISENYYYSKSDTQLYINNEEITEYVSRIYLI